IRSGQILISVKDEQGEERELALLSSPALFGEATLITHSPRNATAKTMNTCELFVLRHEHLSELIESENNVANMFMTLMIDRSRPLQAEHITVHPRTAADGQELVILKNEKNNRYFKLS